MPGLLIAGAVVILVLFVAGALHLDWKHHAALSLAWEIDAERARRSALRHGLQKGDLEEDTLRLLDKWAQDDQRQVTLCEEQARYFASKIPARLRPRYLAPQLKVRG